MLTKFGEEAIGALVLRGVKSDDGSNVVSPRKKKQNNAGMKGVIRGWTVKNRYRRKGIGLGLLEEAVKICADRGWSGPTFADDHANSGRILPSIFNGGFDRRDKMARDMLERALEQSVGSPTSGGRGGKSKK
jgi:Acetyltransferase (GNAT) family